MAYSAIINKKYGYVRIYAVKKSLKGNTNAVSKYVESLLQKYVLKGKKPSGSRGARR
jgi:hypothetical protein